MSLNVMPAGNGVGPPVGRSVVNAVMPGVPGVVVTVKAGAVVPTVKVAPLALVIVGAVLTVNVIVCVAGPLPLLAESVNTYVPAVVGVPVIVAEPLPLSIKFKPGGSEPFARPIVQPGIRRCSRRSSAADRWRRRRPAPS